MTTTPTPSNDSELQLFRVLQRANLLSYYNTFIAQGGDDVQQLCEAGEEEFLEIMALVGMASKPLHVRRLQKALQEYVQNPCIFQIPLTAVGPTPTTPRPINLSAHSSPQPMITLGNSSWVQGNSHMTSRDLSEVSTPGRLYIPYGNCMETPRLDKSSDGNLMCPYPQTPILLDSQIQRLSEAAEGLIKTLPKFEPKPQNSKKRICKELENLMNMPEEDPRRMEEIRKYAAIYGRFDAKRKPEKPLTLHEVSVNEAAAQICRHIPALLTRRDELFPLARQVVRDSGYQYSKGHSSLRSSSPKLGAWNWWPGLTVSTKLFEEDGTKRVRLDSSFKREYDGTAKTVQVELQKIKRQCGCFNCGLVVQERLNVINMELKQIQIQQEHCKEQIQAAREVENYDLIHDLQAELERLTTQQLQLMTEQSDIIKKQKRYYVSKTNSKASASSDTDKLDSTDNDSHYSSCSVSSPSPSHDDQSHDSLPAQSELKMQEMFNIRPSKKNAQLTRQLVQETLMDEGLRVVKELASQIKEEQEDNNNDNSMNDDVSDMHTSTESTINALLSLSQSKNDLRSSDHSE